MIACVTGATGLIGRRVTERLLNGGYDVRGLTRQAPGRLDPRVSWHRADLGAFESVRAFLDGATMVFHCAGEMGNPDEMERVNVEGTRTLIDALPGAGLQYFCFISSAGVVGRTSLQLVDETAATNPGNAYETSKLAAEKLVLNRVRNCKAVALRPTNVIDADAPGVLAYALRRGALDRIHVLLKGAECSHIVHADEVAAAAVFLSATPVPSPEVYFVSYDEMTHMKVAELWGVAAAVMDGARVDDASVHPHLPASVPAALRRLARRPGNRGNVHYSAARLRGAGYEFSHDSVDAVRRVIADLRARGDIRCSGAGSS